MQKLQASQTSNAAMFHVTCRRCDGIICGEILNACFGDALPFRGLDQMLLAIDDMCEAAQFPMAEDRARFLKANTVRVLPTPLEAMTDRWRSYSPYEWLRRPGGTARGRAGRAKSTVFLLHVLYRQHASLQGLVVCRERTAHGVHFRSGLELIRMIDTYMAAP